MKPNGLNRDWQAESDAHTLAEAAAIKGDPKRMKAAAGAAKKMVDEARAKAGALQRVAKCGGRKKP